LTLTFSAVILSPYTSWTRPRIVSSSVESFRSPLPRLRKKTAATIISKMTARAIIIPFPIMRPSSSSALFLFLLLSAAADTLAVQGNNYFLRFPLDLDGHFIFFGLFLLAGHFVDFHDFFDCGFRIFSLHRLGDGLGRVLDLFFDLDDGAILLDVHFIL